MLQILVFLQTLKLQIFLLWNSHKMFTMNSFKRPKMPLAEHYLHCNVLCSWGGVSDSNTFDHFIFLNQKYICRYNSSGFSRFFEHKERLVKWIFLYFWRNGSDGLCSKLSFLPMYILLYNGILIAAHFDICFESKVVTTQISKAMLFIEFQTK